VIEDLPGKCEPQKIFPTPLCSHGSLALKLPISAELSELLVGTTTPDDLEST
jgi:hypothetical protein